MYFLKLYAVGVEPLAVRVLCGQLFLYLAVIVYLALLGIDEQDFSWLQPSLLGYVLWVEVHDSHLRCHHHHVVLGYGIACRAQTVTVEQTAGEASVAEEQGGGTVPRLHQDRVILVEGLQVFGYGVLVIEALWHHHRHGVWQRQAAHHEKLEHVVQRCRVAHARLYDG